MTPQRLSEFFPLAVQSLIHPRIILQRILSIPASRQEVILAGWLVIVLNLLISLAFSLFVPAAQATEQARFPLTTSFVMLALTLFGGAFLLYRIGRAFGGTGSFDNSLKTVVWLNFVFLIAQLPMPFAAAAGQEVASLTMMLILIVAMVQMTAMVMELHGFTKVVPVIFGLIGFQMLFGFFLLIVLGMMGAPIPIEPVN